MSDLVKEGIRIFRSGDKELARQYFEQALADDPEDWEAWLWLSGAVDDDNERMLYLNKVLAIDPDNKAAKKGLRMLLEKQTAAEESGVPVFSEEPLILEEASPASADSAPQWAADLGAAKADASDSETENINLLGAFLLGIGAAAISCMVWYGIVVVTQWQVGYVAVAVGWLVANGVIYGAGRKRGMALQLLSVMITLLAMVASEYLIVRHYLVEYLVEQGATDLPMLYSIDLMLELIVESIKADPLTLLFWGIAGWEAFAIPAKRQRRPT